MKRIIGLIFLVFLILGFIFYSTSGRETEIESAGETIISRIDTAIAEFVEEYGTIQHHISLPEKEFRGLWDYANGTELGRSFTQYGLAYCTLPVTMNTSTEILICSEIVWE